MKKIQAILMAGAVAVATMADDCSGQAPSSEQIQNNQQEQVNKQAVQSVGMPSITFFAEKRQLKEIYELRDRAITTFSYTQDMNGNLHFFCNSIGYGIPYSTQYTNPSQVDYHGSSYGGNVVIPQADPNGLYSPASAEGTWVFCLNPKTKKAQPLYVEPRVIVSPFELPNATGTGHVTK